LEASVGSLERSADGFAHYDFLQSARKANDYPASSSLTKQPRAKSTADGVVEIQRSRLRGRALRDHEAGKENFDNKLPYGAEEKKMGRKLSLPARRILEEGTPGCLAGGPLAQGYEIADLEEPVSVCSSRHTPSTANFAWGQVLVEIQIRISLYHPREWQHWFLYRYWVISRRCAGKRSDSFRPPCRHKLGDGISFAVNCSEKY